MNKTRKTIKSYKDLPDRPLNKEEIEDFILNASPKEKAVLMAIGYTERRITGEEEILSTEDSLRIVESLEQSPRDFSEYLKWVNVYANIVTIKGQIFDSLYYSFVATVAQVKQYLARIDMGVRYANSYSDMYARLCKVMDREEAKDIVLSTANRGDLTLRAEGDRIVAEPNIEFSARIAEEALSLYGNLYTLKGFISSFEVWIKRKRYSALMSPNFAEKIDEIKNYIEAMDTDEILSSHAKDVMKDPSGKEGKILPSYREIEAPSDKEEQGYIRLIEKVKYE